MNSLREIVESAPQLRGLANLLGDGEDNAQPLGPSMWDWQDVRKVLVIRLRSIGDTVLATPALFALKRFLPHAEIHLLLEDWVAPLLTGFPYVDDIITIRQGSATDRARIVRRLRQAKYDVVYNLHGGTTSTLLTRASGARHRVGYAAYQYGRLHNHAAPPAAKLWGREKLHSVEQQLALIGWTGIPVTDRPPTRLGQTDEAAASIGTRLEAAAVRAGQRLVLIHPAAAFDTKRWAIENFAKLGPVLTDHGFSIVAIAAPHEEPLVNTLKELAPVPIVGFTDLSLPEITALAARASLFVGNDSGIAHMAAAVGTPAVVVFGSSNVNHWGPWATAPSTTVLEEMDCQPCHGYFCEKYSAPECIKRVPVQRVIAAIERLLIEVAS